MKLIKLSIGINVKLKPVSDNVTIDLTLSFLRSLLIIFFSFLSMCLLLNILFFITLKTFPEQTLYCFCGRSFPRSNNSVKNMGYFDARRWARATAISHVARALGVGCRSVDTIFVSLGDVYWVCVRRWNRLLSGVVSVDYVGRFRCARKMCGTCTVTSVLVELLGLWQFC